LPKLSSTWQLKKDEDPSFLRLYINLLLVEAKYVWNKIVEEQMEGNPYVDLQGSSQKGPSRGGIDKNLRKTICPKIKFEVWKL
jgi:hypothetical protein